MDFPPSLDLLKYDIASAISAPWERCPPFSFLSSRAKGTKPRVFSVSGVVLKDGTNMSLFGDYGSSCDSLVDAKRTLSVKVCEQAVSIVQKIQNDIARDKREGERLRVEGYKKHANAALNGPQGVIDSLTFKCPHGCMLDEPRNIVLKFQLPVFISKKNKNELYVARPVEDLRDNPLITPEQSKQICELEERRYQLTTLPILHNGTQVPIWNVNNGLMGATVIVCFQLFHFDTPFGDDFRALMQGLKIISKLPGDIIIESSSVLVRKDAFCGQPLLPWTAGVVHEFENAQLKENARVVPVDAVRLGIQEFAEARWGDKPDFVVSGSNVGNNLGSGIGSSDTVGAASEAVLEGIPSFVFSGASASSISYAILTSSRNSSSTIAADTYSSLIIKFLVSLLCAECRMLDDSDQTSTYSACVRVELNFYLQLR
ncbi:hypothetical protein NP233_g10978 [Leucocoprinus birnbaumii]|uniref:Survival protein SurE-like phosphatase/nucleotidase domain-containing protein n=1 Tax=Leucocoprinus birnbaumii TaxID=56174 RepID=A0AAD5VI75_9AGAR|nr:hypothetical protein NP233_g10978 [Leucocoprinus birnbaumii]